MAADLFTLAHALHAQLGEVWAEANGRETEDGALMALWDRLEDLHGEIGETVRAYWQDRGAMVAALEDLERRARHELREVQSGALDATRREG